MVLLNLNGNHDTPKKANGNDYNNVTDIYDENDNTKSKNDNYESSTGGIIGLIQVEVQLKSLKICLKIQKI